MANGFWHRFWDEVKADVFPVSLLSLLTSSALWVMYACRPLWRKTPGWLMQHAIGCDALAAWFFLFFYHVSPFHLNQDKFMEALTCLVAAEMGAHSWRLVVYLHLVVIYRNPFSPERCNLVYPVVVLAITFTGTSICSAQVFNLRAAVSQDNAVAASANEMEFAIVFLLIVYPAFFVLCGGLMQLGVFTAIRSDRSGQHHASVSFFARERLIKHGVAYLSLHAAQLVAGSTVLVLLQATEWRRRWLWHSIMVLLCGRPMWSILGWLLIEYRALRWSSCYSWEVAGARAGASTVAHSAARGSHREARTSLAPSAKDIELTTREATKDMQSSDDVSRSVTAEPLMQTGAHRQMELEVSIPGPRIGGHDFMEELRFEVLYDVARGIGEYAQRQLQHAALQQQRRSGRSASVAQPQTHSFTIVGSRSGRRSTRKASDEEGHVHSIGLLSFRSGTVRNLSSLRPTSPSGPEHHQADHFSAIRETFQISPQQYAREFPNDLSLLNTRWVQKLKESVSEGASGSFFYRVLSDPNQGVTSRFIVKEISKAERNTLLGFLPAYRRHVQEREGRSFIQYFGCHSVPLRWKYAASVHFVVMRNFLPVKMWLIFDLKGATANRRSLKGQSLLTVQAQGSSGVGAPSYGTLRDWEWMDIAMSVDVEPEVKGEIADILRADAEFLSRQGLLDYSLLVGIHRLPQETTASPADREKRLQELERAGGYASLDRQKVYFFGIIDVLEQYNLRWRVQHAVLTMAYYLVMNGSNADGISAMSPELYADRFYTFLHREVLQLPSFGREDEESPRHARFCGECFGRGMPRRGFRRWGGLWERRRRGLVRERMEAERVDFLRRIGELEKEIEELRRNEAVSLGPALGEARKRHGSVA